MPEKSVKNVISRIASEKNDAASIHSLANKATLEAANHVNAMLSNIAVELTRDVPGSCFAKAVISGMSPHEPGANGHPIFKFHRFAYLWAFEKKWIFSRSVRRQNLLQLDIILDVNDGQLSFDRLERLVEGILSQRDYYLEGCTRQFISFRDSKDKDFYHSLN